jgi:hypothetical protein
MAHPENQVAGKQDGSISEHAADQPKRRDQRLQQALEDDEAREALKSLHDMQNRVQKGS